MGEWPGLAESICLSTEIVHNRRTTLIPVALLLVVSVFPLFSTGAAASFSDACNFGQITHGNWKYYFGIGAGTTGPAIKDVQFGGHYQVKFANFRWINLDSDSDLIAMEWTTAQSSSCHQEYNQAGWGTSTITFATTTSSGNDGYSGVTITVQIYEWASGVLQVYVTSSAGASSRVVPFYWDVDINPSGTSADGSDDRLWFDAAAATGGAVAEQHAEVHWAPVAGTHSARTYFVWEGSFPSSDLALSISSEGYTTGESVDAYGLKCTACTDSGSSQYTNGPWDYRGTDPTWDVDVQVVVVNSAAGVGTGSVTTRFSLQAA
jgi:hypothetical protein